MHDADVDGVLLFVLGKPEFHDIARHLLHAQAGKIGVPLVDADEIAGKKAGDDTVDRGL